MTRTQITVAQNPPFIVRSDRVARSPGECDVCDVAYPPGWPLADVGGRVCCGEDCSFRAEVLSVMDGVAVEGEYANALSALDSAEYELESAQSALEDAELAFDDAESERDYAADQLKIAKLAVAEIEGRWKPKPTQTPTLADA